MREATAAIRKDENKGRTMVHARLPWSSEPTEARAGMREAMTSPTTSSMIAALMRIVPIRDCWRGVSFSRVRVYAIGSVSSGVEPAVPGKVSVSSSRLSVDAETAAFFVMLLRAAKVVPRLVEDNAAPAANASRVLYPKLVSRRAKDRTMGAEIPVTAQTIDKGRLDIKTGRLVESPPRDTSENL